jgi:hypothetical protein
MIAAMPSPLHVVCVGQGPRVLFVHGSAADHTTWSIQLASGLRDGGTSGAQRQPMRPPVVRQGDS